MSVSANSLKNLELRTKFTSEYQPKKNGRRASKIKGLAKDLELSKKDITLLILNLFDMKEKQIIALIEDKDKPMLYRAFARAFIEDVKKGSLHNIISLLERAVGKVKEEIEISTEIKEDSTFEIVEPDEIS